MQYDTIELDICRNQARLFEFIANEGYDIEKFTNTFLRSSFCERAFDTIYSRFLLAPSEEIIDCWSDDIVLEKLECDLIFDPAVAWWIGFTYRQLWFETDIPSAELIARIPFSTMCKVYPGYHTVAEDMATDWLCENAGIKKTGKW